MARRKKLNKALAISCAIIFSIFGVLLGFFGQIFLFGEAGYSYPETHNSTASISVGNINVETIKNEDLSIHFLERGNKYTGDCTFIKVGENEILIDAGSRTSSIEPIHDYITDYITDGELEYVINLTNPSWNKVSTLQSEYYLLKKTRIYQEEHHDE